MPIFFDEKKLTKEQLARYDWAVAEYTRIQQENAARSGGIGGAPYRIGPKSALFARLLDGKPPLPYPPPTSYSYPWYDIIEKPGRYQVSISAGTHPQTPATNAPHAQSDECIVLNQCAWAILHKNQGAADFSAFLRQENDPLKMPKRAFTLLHAALAGRPEYILTYGNWGEFKLVLGRIIRRGRRDVVESSAFDVHTLDGGNPVVVKVLRSGAEIRAKSDATLATVLHKLGTPEQELTAIDRITLASESAIPRSDDPAGDDLVEFDCDGWVLEKI